MSPRIYFKFHHHNAHYTNMFLTKLGHRDMNIDEIYTFTDLNNMDGDKYVVVTLFSKASEPEVAAMRSYLSKALDVDEAESATDALDQLFADALNLVPGTKRKFWFRHATYVSPKD